MTIPKRFATGDATFYVLVVSDDMGTADDEGGDAIVWEHPFPEGTELRDVLKRQHHLGGRYGTSWVAECRILPETRCRPATVKECLMDREVLNSGPVEIAGVGHAPAEARCEHVPPRFIPGPQQVAECGGPCEAIGPEFCNCQPEPSPTAMVPITERKPMAQELDSKGRCWVYDSFMMPGWLLIPEHERLGRPFLPHWVLPIHGQEADRG